MNKTIELLFMLINTDKSLLISLKLKYTSIKLTFIVHRRLTRSVVPTYSMGKEIICCYSTCGAGLWTKNTNKNISFKAALAILNPALKASAHYWHNQLFSKFESAKPLKL